MTFFHKDIQDAIDILERKKRFGITKALEIIGRIREEEHSDDSKEQAAFRNLLLHSYNFQKSLRSAEIACKPDEDSILVAITRLKRAQEDESKLIDAIHILLKFLLKEKKHLKDR